MRLLDRFRVAERSRELDVGAVEVKRFVLRPQAPDDRARFGEASDRVGEVVEGQAARDYRQPILQAALDALRPANDD